MSRNFFLCSDFVENIFWHISEHLKKKFSKILLTKFITISLRKLFFQNIFLRIFWNVSEKNVIKIGAKFIFCRNFPESFFKKPITFFSFWKSIFYNYKHFSKIKCQKKLSLLKGGEGPAYRSLGNSSLHFSDCTHYTFFRWCCRLSRD